MGLGYFSTTNAISEKSICIEPVLKREMTQVLVEKQNYHRKYIMSILNVLMIMEFDYIATILIDFPLFITNDSDLLKMRAK